MEKTRCTLNVFEAVCQLITKVPETLQIWVPEELDVPFKTAENDTEVFRKQNFSRQRRPPTSIALVPSVSRIFHSLRAFSFTSMLQRS